MSGMTPIKVRGKRSGPSAGKWHKDKQRPSPTLSSSSSSRASSATPQSQDSSATQQSRSRKRKRPQRELSRLEELPSEVLQTIFEYSQNLDLPSVSPILLKQLSSLHMCNRLTDAISESISSGKRPGQGTYAAGHRLLESKFMTWDFFRAWIRRQSMESPECGSGEGKETLSDTLRRCPWWIRHVNAPSKIFRGPWTASNIQLLRFFEAREESSLSSDLAYPSLELARQGTYVAIEDANSEVLQHLLCYHMDFLVDSDMVRTAVTHYGCNTDVVDTLLRAARYIANPDSIALDTELWKWAEKAVARGDEKGEWLKYKLRAYAGAVKDSSEE